MKRGCVDKKVVSLRVFCLFFFPSGFSIFRPTRAKESRERNLLVLMRENTGENFLRLYVCVCRAFSRLFFTKPYATKRASLA